MTLLSVILAVALVAHCGVHVAMAVALARRQEYRRATVGFFVPPLAPLWAWRAGMRPLAFAWLGTLAIYAVGISVAH